MLTAGKVLYDNDPRYRGRTVEVIRVEGSFAICKCGPRQMQIRLAYIFTDGEPRALRVFHDRAERRRTLLCQRHSAVTRGRRSRDRFLRAT